MDPRKPIRRESSSFFSRRRHWRVRGWGPLVVSIAAACGSSKPAEPPRATDFWHASGTQIVDAQGSPVFLKGVSFGNEVWADVEVPDDHDESDFQRLAAMGANTTRFLLNAHTFEDDAGAGLYKEAGWRWLDQNIAWSRTSGVRLILNMHVPPGGFQSNGEGGALWSNPANQDRLVSLWKAIAARYANEPAVVGYGLVNEPEPLQSRQQWTDLANRLTDAIRSVDRHHILFVERPIAIAGKFVSDADMNLFTVPDDNVAYEFHFYDPTDYTFQLQPWNDTPDGGRYPDPTKVAGITEQWINLATFDAPRAPAGSSGWTFYEGPPLLADDPAIAAGKPTLVGRALGSGVIAFDDLVIKELDGQGQVLREVAHVSPVSEAGWYFWSSDGSGKGGTTSDCKTSATCLTITGTADDASWGGYGAYFVPTRGHRYSVSGWMRGTDLPPGAQAQIRLDFIGSSTPVTARNKDGLARLMAPYLAWGTAHHVPLFLGEFGAYRACFSDDKGGLAWVDDVYDLAAAGTPHVAGLSFHQYHEDAFALFYGNGGPIDPANANQALIDLLTDKLRAAP